MQIFGPSSFLVSLVMGCSMPTNTQVNTDMLCLRHHQQVIRMIVPFITVNMVNNFPNKQFPAYFLFSNHPMHMPIFKLHIVGSTAGVSLDTMIPKRSPSTLFFTTQ